MDKKVGAKFHDLTLVQRCGSGAYGQVWLCRDLTGTLLALKIISKDRQEVELKGVSTMRQKLPAHENVLRIYHIGEDEDCLWYTMDAADNLTPDGGSYLPDTLDNRLRRNDKIDILKVMRELLAGLAVLHEAGMVHRDVKPANILFIKGKAVIGDLGMVVSDASCISLAGTMGFIPPEVRDGSSSPSAVGKLGDIYAAGMVLYCMLTNNSPALFPSLPTDIENTPLTRRLNHLSCRICQRKSSARITDIGEILNELNEIERLSDTSVRFLEYYRFYKKTIIKFMLVFVAMVLLAAGGYYGWSKLSPPTQPQPVVNSRTKEYSCSILPYKMQIPKEWEPITAKFLGL